MTKVVKFHSIIFLPFVFSNLQTFEQPSLNVFSNFILLFIGILCEENSQSIKRNIKAFFQRGVSIDYVRIKYCNVIKKNLQIIMKPSLKS